MRDVDYIISLCDEILGMAAERNKRFFLASNGDLTSQPPVDAYYPSLKLIIEYEPEAHGHVVLPKPDITLLVLSCSDFEHRHHRLRRNRDADRDVLFRKLRAWLPEIPCATVH